MDEEKNIDRPQLMSRFLHEFKKNMANVKVKSFYANHLCKKNCIEANLNANQDKCLSDCDEWLKKFYDDRRNNTPELPLQVLYQVESKVE